MRLSAGGGKGFGARIGASETEDLMTRVDEFRNKGRTDKACSTGDENSHGKFSFASIGDRIRGPVISQDGR